jgi:5'-methylthioadenosine phosphorylase
MAQDEPSTATVGVFGGSGLYSLLDDVTSVEVTTPWGEPSAPLSVGWVKGTRVAFLPRHGTGHHLPPHRVNYRANIEAFRSIGATTVLAPFACGSLQREMAPGDFVVVDQFVDRTWGRESTFFDDFTGGPNHATMANPYDPVLRRTIVEAATGLGLPVHDGGTVVAVNGPRFSTRAESASFAASGWHLVNMTQCPEAALAREAGLRYAAVGLVTDYDSGLDGDPTIEPVTQEAVFQFFDQNIARLRELIVTTIDLLT